MTPEPTEYFSQIEEKPEPKSKWKNRLKKFGMLIFLFYLLKGIGWLVLFFFFGKTISERFF